MRRSGAGSGRLVTGLGTASGWLTVQGDLVLAGGFAGFGSTWPDGSEGNRVYAFSLAALLALPEGEVLDAADDGVLFAGPAHVELLADGRLLSVDTDWSTSTTTIALHTLEGDGTAVKVAKTETVAAGATYTDARPVPGSRNLLLQWASGYAVVGR